MRARNIKPGFFKNEDIAELSPIDRLFFIGMWCAADREGRLVDRPKRIKMDVMPCDNYDPEKGIQRLVDLGFVERYFAAGQAVIQIVNFLKHQTPHSLEKDSDLPDKDGNKTVHKRKNGRVCSDKKQFFQSMQDEKEQLDNCPRTENTVFDNTLDLLDSLDSKAKSKASTVSEIPLKPEKDPPPASTEAGRACVLMRKAGAGITNPSHPDLLAALAAGVTPEALAETAAEAVQLKKSKPFAWAIATARGRLDEITTRPGASHDHPRESIADRNARRAAEIIGRLEQAERVGAG